ncbi:hypothetical protein MKX01_025615 [Papaver californicum]|nr:hypothetical protein MKX01_025615 [Papaver californicum]
MNMKISLRSAVDIKNFLALDVANCNIERCYYLNTILIQIEYLAPTWGKVQGLFLQEHSKRLSHLNLEISKACRNVADAIITDYETNSVKVTIRENYNTCPVMRTREWTFARLEQQQEPVKENTSIVSQLVMDHRNYMDSLLERQAVKNIAFISSDDSDTDEDDYVISDSDEDEDVVNERDQRSQARFLKKVLKKFNVA